MFVICEQYGRNWKKGSRYRSCIYHKHAHIITVVVLHRQLYVYNWRGRCRRSQRLKIITKITAMSKYLWKRCWRREYTQLCFDEHMNLFGCLWMSLWWNWKMENVPTRKKVERREENCVHVYFWCTNRMKNAAIIKHMAAFE